jgi:hypothetical protein
MPRMDPEPAPARGVPTDAERRIVLVADVSTRLRVACSHLSNEDFRSLVDDIVEVTMRFEDSPQDHYAARLQRVIRRTPSKPQSSLP